MRNPLSNPQPRLNIGSDEDDEDSPKSPEVKKPKERKKFALGLHLSVDDEEERKDLKGQ